MASGGNRSRTIRELGMIEEGFHPLDEQSAFAPPGRRRDQHARRSLRVEKPNVEAHQHRIATPKGTSPVSETGYSSRKALARRKERAMPRSAMEDATSRSGVRAGNFCWPGRPTRCMRS
jgi:hypothetical protein